MKICPFCSESIQDSAVKCRFCGEFLEKKPDKKKNNNEKSSKLENAKNNTQNILKKAPEYLAYLG